MSNGNETACQFRIAGRRKWPDIRCWKNLLKTEWLPLVVEPADFQTHQDQELAAKRTIGYDARGMKCYYAHRFMIPVLRSDDDETFYEASAYREEVEAWLLSNDRWLVYKLVHAGGCSVNDGFTFADGCPR